MALKPDLEVSSNIPERPFYSDNFYYESSSGLSSLFWPKMAASLHQRWLALSKDPKKMLLCGRSSSARSSNYFAEVNNTKRLYILCFNFTVRWTKRLALILLT